MRGRDLLSIAELSPDEVDTILRTALSLKRDGGGDDLLRGKTLALLFEKPSLRRDAVRYSCSYRSKVACPK